jgi:hypothetical protein
MMGRAVAAGTRLQEGNRRSFRSFEWGCPGPCQNDAAAIRRYGERRGRNFRNEAGTINDAPVATNARDEKRKVVGVRRKTNPEN